MWKSSHTAELSGVTVTGGLKPSQHAFQERKFMARIKLQPPWIQFYEKLTLLFEEDSHIRILYDEEENEIRIFADNTEKAVALERLLPSENVFGNVKQKITIIPPNKEDLDEPNIDCPAVVLFADNPIVEEIERVSGVFGYELIYIMFRKEVVQYFNDDISCYGGIRSTLYQDIAKEVFKFQAGVYYCTSEEDMPLIIGKPEWP